MKEYDEYGFLQAVLEIPSVNGADDEGAVARFLCDFLRDCGVDSQVIPIDDSHADVIANITGESEDLVVLNGHLDTVPYGKREEWDTPPERCVRRNNRFYGRGASDMKSGLAAMVYVLGTMVKAGCSPRMNLCFMGTCDEEKGGLGARKILQENRMPQPSLLLIGEPTGLKPGVAQKGCMWIELTVDGVTSHGAYPDEGINAVEYGMDIAREFKEIIGSHSHGILGTATVQVTKIQGGIAPNMTPDRAEIFMDVRTVPGMEPEDVVKMLEDVCSRRFKRCPGRGGYHYNVVNQRRAIEIEGSHPWGAEFDEVLKQMGLSTQRVGINYFTDASILTEYNHSMPVLLLGPGEPSLCHKPNEYVELEKYSKYVYIMKKVFFTSFEND